LVIVAPSDAAALLTAAHRAHQRKVEGKMNIVPVLWAVWGVTVLFMVVVSIYSSRLAKNEEDQLFLAESSNHAKSEQDAIALKVGKIAPVKRTAVVLMSAMTLLVVVYYVFDAMRQLR
jgi:hypothetical protein